VTVYITGTAFLLKRLHSVDYRIAQGLKIKGFRIAVSVDLRKPKPAAEV